MRNHILIAALTLITSASAFAGSTLRQGDYVGQTSDGRECGLRIAPQEFATDTTRIMFSWKKSGGGYESGSVRIDNKDIVIQNNTFVGKGKNDIAIAKVRISLANDGTPLEAKMGVGMFVKVGYDETCLKLKAE